MGEPLVIGYIDPDICRCGKHCGRIAYKRFLDKDDKEIARACRTHVDEAREVVRRLIGDKFTEEKV